MKFYIKTHCFAICIQLIHFLFQMHSFSTFGLTQRKPKQTGESRVRDKRSRRVYHRQTNGKETLSPFRLSLVRQASLSSFSMVFHAAVCRQHTHKLIPAWLLFTVFHFFAMVNSVYSKSRRRLHTKKKLNNHSKREYFTWVWCGLPARTMADGGWVLLLLSCFILSHIDTQLSRRRRAAMDGVMAKDDDDSALVNWRPYVWSGFAFAGQGPSRFEVLLNTDMLR